MWAFGTGSHRIDHPHKCEISLASQNQIHRNAQSRRTIIGRQVKALFLTFPFVGALIYVSDLAISWVTGNAWIVLLFGAQWLAILHLCWHILDHICPSFYDNPKVCKVLRDSRLLIVERAPWLGMDVLIAVYVSEQELEQLVCCGRVVNMQQNDLVQIAVESTGFGVASEDEMWSTLESSRRSILIRPGISQGGQ